MSGMVLKRELGLDVICYVKSVGLYFYFKCAAHHVRGLVEVSCIDG